MYWPKLVAGLRSRAAFNQRFYTPYSRRGHYATKTRLESQTKYGQRSKSMKHIPALTQDIDDKWADNMLRIPRSKQQKDYSNSIEGYIHDVAGRRSLL